MRLSPFLALSFFVLTISLPAFSQEDVKQEMQGFSLSGFSDKGKKTWQINGSAADIFSDIVVFHNIKAQMYSDKDSLNLVAKEGRYDKKRSLIHLQEDVVATSESGARLTTDSLDWLQNNQLIKTDDKVVIDKENILTTAYGMRAKPDMKLVRLIRDAQVQIREKGPEQEKTTTITCSGVLELDYQKQIAIFNKDVLVDSKDGQIRADRIRAYFDFNNKAILKIIATGKVKIVREGNVAYSQKATYLPGQKLLELTGRPKIIIYSTDSMEGILDAPLGN